MRAVFRLSLALAALALPAAAHALDPVTICPGQVVYRFADGRLLGHLPYVELPSTELASAPAGFAIGQPCRLARDVLPDLTRLLAAAEAAPGVGKRLRAVSCFRSVARQGAVFCGQIGPGRRFADAADRARFVGPPGYSEHATGYALDFGIRPSPGCADVDPCLARSVAGQWLLAHAPEYGFELSFPQGNAQGVTWEPWHWRWVGTSADVPGAALARQVVARARTSYPADPAVIDAPAVVPGPAVPTDPLASPPPTVTPDAPGSTRDPAASPR